MGVCRGNTMVPNGALVKSGTVGAVMRDNLAVALITVAVLLGTAGIVGVARRDGADKKPVDVSFRALDADPEFYRDVVVRIPTDGSQPGESPNELVFRRRADQPPVVACVGPKPP